MDDAWIAVDGKVYDITEHLVNHDGWGNAGALGVLRVLVRGRTSWARCGSTHCSTRRAFGVPPRARAGVTTPLSILAHAGTECSAEFHAIHRTIPVAYKQLAAFFIGPLADY